MENNREIDALLHLLDDPDEEVFLTVQQRLMHYGRPIIPNLENMWEHTISEAVQDRIEMTIHGIHYQGLRSELMNWKNGEAELLYGALLVAKYQYPDLQSLQSLQEIERMRRNIWLEMNSYMTPLEQVKVVESILYNYYKLRGGEVSYGHPSEFLLHKVIETKKANAIGAGVLYLIFAQLLDLPVRVLNIPRQFVLAWIDPLALFNNDAEQTPSAQHIKFFIDPNSGSAFSHRDIDLYFSRINVPPKGHHYRPLDNLKIIKQLLTQFSMCFDKANTAYKLQELQALAQLLSAD
jgi:hypothetical protein